MDEKFLIEDNNADKEFINLIIKKCKHLVGSLTLRVTSKKAKRGTKESKLRSFYQTCTRWGSTFYLLKSILINKTALKRIQHDP